MTGFHVPPEDRPMALDRMLAAESGYGQLIQWLATLDPLPLQRELGLPTGTLTVLRDTVMGTTLPIDLLLMIDGIPRAIAQLDVDGTGVGDKRWVYDQWCGVRNIAPTRRFHLRLGGDTPTWDDAPEWRDASVLSLLAAWRDTSELTFVRELASHAHALVEEVPHQARGLLAQVESEAARRVITTELTAALLEHYPESSGVAVMTNVVNTDTDTGGGSGVGRVDGAGGLSGGGRVGVDRTIASGSTTALRTTLIAPVGTGGRLVLEVEPRGGARATAGCDWQIRVHTTVRGASLLSHRTAALAVMAVPAFALARLRDRLHAVGLGHLASQVSAARDVTAVSSEFTERTDGASGAVHTRGRVPGGSGWPGKSGRPVRARLRGAFPTRLRVRLRARLRARLRNGQRALAAGARPPAKTRHDHGLGLQFTVANSVTADELRSVCLVLAEMLIDAVATPTAGVSMSAKAGTDRGTAPVSSTGRKTT